MYVDVPSVQYYWCMPVASDYSILSILLCSNVIHLTEVMLACFSSFSAAAATSPSLSQVRFLSEDVTRILEITIQFCGHSTSCFASVGYHSISFLSNQYITQIQFIPFSVHVKCDCCTQILKDSLPNS